MTLSPRTAPAFIAQVVTPLAWRFAVVLAAASTLAVAWTISPMRSEPVVHASGAGTSILAEAAAGAVTPAAKLSYPAIAEHPLFYPSRSPWIAPPPPPPKPVSAATNSLTGYAVIGVITSGSARSALIRPPGAKKTITMAEGQELDGWKLQEITRAGLRFGAGDASYEMKFLKPSETRR